VQGDESVIKVNTMVRPDAYQIANKGERFGWVLGKFRASLRSEEISFLGRSQWQVFNIRGRLKILRLMCFPEFKVEDPKISTARAKMLTYKICFS
jgi:hypothetical protein